MLTQNPPFWGGTLLLLKIADDLVAVLALVLAAGDVDPVFAMGMLEDELVEVDMVRYHQAEQNIKVWNPRMTKTS